MSIAILLLFVLAWPSPAEDWTRFRGPNGSGVSKDSGFPVEFDKTRNLLWRTPVRAGKSSPVLTEHRIFLTGFDNEKLLTQCFDRETGKLLWERVEQRTPKPEGNLLNNPAAITPVTDGENVYVFFKDFGLLSYDATGKARWKVPLGPFINSMGLGASPIVAGDAVILQVDQVANSYIASFDQRNGELRWKVQREESEGWATPLLYQPAGSDALILTAGPGQYGAHRFRMGRECSANLASVRRWWRALFWITTRFSRSGTEPIRQVRFRRPWQGSIRIMMEEFRRMSIWISPATAPTARHPRFTSRWESTWATATGS